MPRSTGAASGAAAAGRLSGWDIEASHCPAIVGDNARMPFADAAFDVVVYDPPHIPNQGWDKSKEMQEPGVSKLVSVRFQAPPPIVQAEGAGLGAVS